MRPAYKRVMFLRTTLFATVLGAACVLGAVAGCAPKTDPNAPKVYRIGMVTDIGGLGDRSFNDSAYAGLLEAKQKLHADVTVLQSRSAADYQPNLTVLANKEYDQIIGIGFLMARDMNETAQRFPKRNFAIIDAIGTEPNIESVTFREQDGSFLAGALAAMVSKTHTIAFVGGIDIPLLRKFEAGYTAGAHEIDPKTKVLVKYVGSFDDVASGKEIANVLYDQGTDIIFVAAGKAGLGAIDAVKARSGDYIIGVDSNQDALAPGKILTSMVKRVDVGVLRIVEDISSQKPVSGPVELGLKDGAVSLTDFRYTRNVVTPAIRKRLAAIQAAIIDGRIDVPATREQLAAFKPVPLRP
jgi:basic membrane protein A